MENPTGFPPPREREARFAKPLLLDVDEIEPLTDVTADIGRVVPFRVLLGPEHPREGVEYAWYLDGDLLPGNSSERALRTEDLSAGTHVVEVLIREGDLGATLAWKLQLREGSAENRPPVIIQTLPPRRQAVLAGEEAAFAVIASDVDAGDVLGYTWTIDGRPAAAGAGELRVDTAALAPGEYRVAVLISDGRPRPAAAETRHEWVLAIARRGSHALPHISGAWPIGSPRMDPEGKLRFEVRAEVPDGEDVVSYRWEVDGILQDARDAAFHLAPALNEEGLAAATHRVTCRLVAGHEETGETGACVGWTVHVTRDSPAFKSHAGNRPPAARTAASPVLAAPPGESRAFRVHAEDPDGDVLTYGWTVDGRPQPADGPVFAYTPLPEETGSVVRIAVRVNDGAASGQDGRELGAWNLKVGSLADLVPDLSGEAFILDNGQSGTKAAGDWLNSSAGGALGANSLYATTAGHRYTYEQAVPPGRYQVLLRWTSWPSRSAAVPVTIHHRSGAAKVRVNQLTGGGRWHLLGTYDFGATARVTIAAAGKGRSACADAVCWNPILPASSPAGGDGPAPAQKTFEIEDGAAGTSSAGTWAPSSAPRSHQGRSLYARGEASYTFERALTSPGTYDVHAWWTEWSSRSAAAAYEIVHAGGTTTIEKDQRRDGGKWNLLGKFAFGAGVKVTLRAAGGDTVSADAVRFAPAGSGLPSRDEEQPLGTDLIVDDGDPGTSGDGFWQTSSGPNPFGGGSLYASGRGAYVYDFAVPEPGTYGVHVWYTEWPSRDGAVPYEVRHQGGTDLVRVDQRVNGGRWIPLGDFAFDGRGRVTVRVTGASTVSADALRLSAGGGTATPGFQDPPPAGPAGAPGISELAAFPLTPRMARVSWRTSFPGNSLVHHGKTPAAADRTRSVTGLRWDHSVVLENLDADTLYHVRVESSSNTVSDTSETVSFRTPDATPGYTITPSHPRVYLDADDVAAIRERIGRAPYRGWWERVVSFADGQLDRSLAEQVDRDPSHNVALAFAGLISGEEAYQDEAIAVALKVASLSTFESNQEIRGRIDQMIPAYDWLHSRLSATQKATLRARLAQFAAILEDRVNETEFAVGHSNGDQNGAFLAALAIHGEEASAAGIIARAMKRYHEGFWPFWREHGSENGGSFKSAWYTTIATTFNHEVFSAWKSATGRNLFQAEKAWFSGLADWYLYSRRGDKTWVRHGDVGIQEGFDEQERHILIHIAREYRDGEAQWLADRIRDHLGLFGPPLVSDLIWHDASVAPRAPSGPLSRHFKGCGMVFCQESWDVGAARANFRAVPYYMAGHNHLDQCSFTIFYRGGLAIDSGIYDDFASRHHTSYYTRTIAHNAILVEDPNEVFRQYGEERPADGGQYYLEPSRVPYAQPRRITDLTGDDGFHLGGIQAYEDTSLYTYALGDGTLAYNPKKMAAYHRHFLWLKDVSGWAHPVIAVFDEVRSTQSSFRKTYLLHTEEKPKLNGNLASAEKSGGILYQRTVFPQSAMIELVGGVGKEFQVQGRNYPPLRKPKPLEEAGAWRIEVSPSTARTQDEFLHLLHIAERGTSPPPSPQPIAAGALKGCETQGLAILFAVKLRSVKSAAYTLSGPRRNLVFGLTPGQSIDFHLDGRRIAILKSSPAGSLDFENPTAGRIELTVK